MGLCWPSSLGYLSDPRLARLAEALEAVNPRAVRSDSRVIEV